MNTGKIDFGILGGPVYVGRANGMRARKQVGGDVFDRSEGTVLVHIPENTYSVNSSFFLGMFGPSLERFGSRDDFMRHYHFEAPPHIAASLGAVIDRALSSRGRLALTG